MTKTEKLLRKQRRLIRKYEKQRETGIAWLKRSDETMNLIVQAVGISKPVDMADGHLKEIVDVFEGQNKVFRAHGIGRYEVKTHRKVTEGVA